jgi:hypothetical protein
MEIQNIGLHFNTIKSFPAILIYSAGSNAKFLPMTRE